MTEEKKKRDLGFKLEDLLKEGERAAAAIGTVMGTSPDLVKRNSLAVGQDSSQESSVRGPSESSKPEPRRAHPDVPASPPIATTPISTLTKGRPKQDLRNTDRVRRTVLYLSEDILQIAKIKAIEEKTRPSVIIDEFLRRSWLG